MNIEMPTGEEKENSVAYIIQSCVKKHDGIFSLCRKMLSIFGIRNIFFGITDCIYLAAVISAVFLSFCFAVPERFCLAALFFVSPFFFIGSYAFSLFKEHICGTLEIQRVCKFTPVQLSAVRMLFFSVLGLIPNLFFSVIFSEFRGVSFFRLFFMSCASLFLYSSVNILSGIFLPKKFPALVQPAVWVALGLTLLFLTQIGEIGGSIIYFFETVSDMPVKYTAIAAAASFSLSLCYLQIYVKRQKNIFSSEEIKN